LYNIDGLFLGLLIVIGILYFRGYKSLTQRGDIWPRGRSVSFISGWVLALYVSCGGLSIYAHYSFAYHMIAHMLMGMGVPILFTLSAPITLALRTLPTSRDGIELGLRQLLANILNSRYVRIISNPFVALGIFDGSLFLLYFTPLFGDLMLSHTGHFLMNLHFLLSGLLFFFIIIGVDPNPHKIPYIARIVLLAAAMSIHSFFSIAVLSSTTLMDHGYFTLLGKTWIGNYLADQHSAGAIGWAMSDLPILFALIATFVQWMRDDKKDADRFDRNSARAHAAGEEDELDKYNNYLASLNKLDRDH
jgi:putative copper resistance protein D